MEARVKTLPQKIILKKWSTEQCCNLEVNYLRNNTKYVTSLCSSSNILTFKEILRPKYLAGKHLYKFRKTEHFCVLQKWFWCKHYNNCGAWWGYFCFQLYRDHKISMMRCQLVLWSDTGSCVWGSNTRNTCAVLRSVTYSLCCFNIILAIKNCVLMERIQKDREQNSS